MQNFLSKHFDLPVSIFVDDTEWSIAIFWDCRLFGQAKFFDKEILELFQQLEIEQSIELKLNLNFDCDDMLQTNVKDLIFKGV
jgi:hypothetical protein